MKKVFAFVFIINTYFNLNLEAQLNLSSNFYKHLTGTISIINPATEKMVELPLKMNFRRNDNKITGTYYHNRDSVNYNFSGDIKENGSFEAQVLDFNYYFMGTLSGSFTSETDVTCVYTDAEKTKKTPMNLKENYTSSVRFKLFSIAEKYHIQKNEKFPSVSVRINYLHPLEYKFKPTIIKIAPYIESSFFGETSLKGDPMGNINKKRNENFNDYKALIEPKFVDEKELYEATTWNVAFESDITFNDDSVLTVQVNSLEDHGGTGIIAVNHYCYDLKKGLQIKTSDIFNANFQKGVTELIVKKIRQWNEIGEKESLEELGFQVNMIVPNENIYVDRAGIGFYFNAFEIFDNESRAYFTFQELGKFLKPQSPISHLFPKNMDFTLNVQRKFTVKGKKEIKRRPIEDEGEVKY